MSILLGRGHGEAQVRIGYSVTDLHDIAGNHPIHLHVYDEDVYTNPKGQRLFSVRRHSRVPDRLFS